MNIKFIHSALFLLFTLGFVTSCNSSKKIAKNSTSVDHTPKVNALVWKVEGENLKQPSYVFGTIHMIDSEDFFWPKGLLQAIDQSEKIVFEINMEEMTDMNAQMKMMSKMIMKDGVKLSDLLTKDEYKVVDDFFKKKGLPLVFFEKMKPAFVTVITSLDMDPNALKDGSIKSYEMELSEIAKDKKIKMGGLETMEYQMSMFDSIPYEVQAKELVKSIQETAKGADELEMLTKLYKEQNLLAMDSIFQSEEVMGDTELLLDKRNKNWIPLMIQDAVKQPTLFAVGAGHLAGVNGVISLLRKEGYKLTPISHE